MKREGEDTFKGKLFRPRYEEAKLDPQIPLLDPNQQPHEYFVEQAQLKRHCLSNNIGHFYASLFHAHYGGRLTAAHIGKNTTTRNGEARKFIPDIVKVVQGDKQYVEVKAINRQSAGHILSTHQLENYAYLLLERLLDDSQKHASASYALFRYGKTEGNGIGKLPYTGVMQKLASQTFDVLHVPLNMVFLLSYLGKEYGRDQTNSGSSLDEKRERQLKGTPLSLLHNAPDGLEQVLATAPRGFGDELSDMLALSGLKRKQVEIPPHYVCRVSIPDDELAKTWESLTPNSQQTKLAFQSPAVQPKTVIDPNQFNPKYAGLEPRTGTQHYSYIKVQPFRVTTFTNETSAWNDTFKEHHKRILRLLRLRDLYAETRPW